MFCRYRPWYYKIGFTPYYILAVWSFLGPSVPFLSNHSSEVIFFFLFTVSSHITISPSTNPKLLPLHSPTQLALFFSPFCLPFCLTIAPSFLSYFLLWLFLPLVPHLSSLIIYSFPLIYHFTCPRARSSPPTLAYSSFFIASQFTFGYSSSLSAIPHFNLGKRSLLFLESRATIHQLQSKLMRWLNRRSMVL